MVGYFEPSWTHPPRLWWTPHTPNTQDDSTEGGWGDGEGAVIEPTNPPTSPRLKPLERPNVGIKSRSANDLIHNQTHQQNNFQGEGGGAEFWARPNHTPIRLLWWGGWQLSQRKDCIHHSRPTPSLGMRRVCAHEKIGDKSSTAPDFVVIPTIHSVSTQPYSSSAHFPQSCAHQNCCCHFTSPLRVSLHQTYIALTLYRHLRNCKT